jgi:hypothetical protein
MPTLNKNNPPNADNVVYGADGPTCAASVMLFNILEMTIVHTGPLQVMPPLLQETGAFVQASLSPTCKHVCYSVRPGSSSVMLDNTSALFGIFITF